MKKCLVIDKETGELLDDNFQLEELKDTLRKQKFIEKSKIDEQFKNIQQEICGNFVFFIYQNLEMVLDMLNDSDLVKFIYLGTYVKDNGVLKFDNGRYINKNNLEKLLKLNKKSFNKFYKLLIEKELLFENGEELIININYFYRGSNKNYKVITGEKLEEFTRIYIKSAREIYEANNIRSHKRISIIYKLLPYINWKYNIICENIREKDELKLNPITLKKVAEMLDYNKKNLKQLEKDLFNLKVNDKFVFLTVRKMNNNNEMMEMVVVNPTVYYKGDNLQELNYLIKLFKIQ